jgi:hypothetical protein
MGNIGADVRRLVVRRTELLFPQERENINSDSKGEILIMYEKPYRIMKQLLSVCFSSVAIHVRHCSSAHRLCCRPREGLELHLVG